jgi:multiple sugar transport system substrate-binding protein
MRFDNMEVVLLIANIGLIINSSKECDMTFYYGQYYFKYIEKKFWLCCLCFLFFLQFVPSNALAGAQAQRAVQAVKKLIAEGKIPKDATLRIVAKEGNIINFWGHRMALKSKWEEATGIMLDSGIRPNLPVLEFMRQQKDFDITLARQREYPDLYLENLVLDLTPYVRRFGFDINANPKDGFFRPKAQTEFDDKIVAIPADGDVAVMYLRRDLMDDPAFKAEFSKKYHRPLKIPATWDDYLRLVQFFHRPEKGIFGTCEHRDPQTGWMFWMPRYASQARPNQYLFDDEMHPLINSAAGVAATRNYVQTVAYSPTGITGEKNHYTYAMPIFRDGKSFAYIITTAGAKGFSGGNSAVKDKFMVCPMPGTMVDDRLVHRTSFIYGNNIVVAASSRHPELAFLFAMWFSDPEISNQALEVRRGIADPFRYNHVHNQKLRPLYTRQVLEILPSQFEIAVPAGTGLPGDADYIQALNHNLWLAAKGKITAETAMAQTAAQWEKITDKFGRRQQIRYWKLFKEKFPG